MSDAQPYTREELNFVTPMLSDFASSTPGPNQRLRECLLRLLATAKQGVEEKERDHRVRTTGPGPLLLRLCERFDALLSLDHRPARQASDVYDEAFHTAVHALHDLRAFARIISPTRRDAADAAAAVERGVRERSDTERLDWLLSNLWDDNIEIEGAPGSRRCLSFNGIDPDNLATRRDQLDYVREVIDAARKGVPARSGRRDGEKA